MDYIRYNLYKKVDNFLSVFVNCKFTDSSRINIKIRDGVCKSLITCMGVYPQRFKNKSKSTFKIEHLIYKNAAKLKFIFKW